MFFLTILIKIFLENNNRDFLRREKGKSGGHMKIKREQARNAWGKSINWRFFDQCDAIMSGQDKR